MRILELFCGIGSVTAAVGDSHSVVGAIDINEHALEVYRANFQDVTLQKEITSLSDSVLRGFDAELWWMSPPCQPFTRRGLRKDLQDSRTHPLLRLIDAIANIRPTRVALENVIGFEGSDADRKLREMFKSNGYEVATIDLCSSELGLSNLRPRFFLIASRDSRPTLSKPSRVTSQSKIESYLDPPSQLVRWNPDLDVGPGLLEEYESAVNIVSVDDEMTRCFTSGYGRSIVRSGSYLKTKNGYRRFSPTEVARFLGLPNDFCLPSAINTHQAWKLLGNAVCVRAAAHVIRSLT